MIKSVIYTSKYHNKNKGDNVFDLFTRIAEIKNKSSKYIFENKQLLLSYDGIKKLKSDYKNFKDDVIPAWNIQKEHQLVVDFYKNSLDKHLKNFNLKLQKEIVFEYYKRDTKTANKGDVKSVELKFKQTHLTKFIKYIMFLELDKEDIVSQIHNEVIADMCRYYQTKPYFNRIFELAKDKQQRLLNKIKLIEFEEKSSIMLDHVINKARFEIDSENSLFKYWFIFRMGKKEFRLPLQINDNYHNNKRIPIANGFLIYPSKKGNKINITTTYDAEKPKFKPFHDVMALDLNLKNNFCVLSNGYIIDFDREFVKNIVEKLKELDKIGYKNLNKDQLKKLKKIYGQLKWYTSLLIHELLNYLEENNITDIVVENLLLGGKFGINEEFGIPYARLAKLLHISNVKNELLIQAEKRGICVHITPSQFTSQTCPVCGHISRNNRPTQEEFKCEECGHEANADLNASKNILLRFTSDVLRKSLHNTDEYGRLTPKKLNKWQIKRILERYYEDKGEFVSPCLAPDLLNNKIC